MGYIIHGLYLCTFFQSHRSCSVLGVRVLDQGSGVEHAALVGFLNAPTCLCSTLCAIRYMIAHFLFQG
jgi:hypothetical protein